MARLYVPFPDIVDIIGEAAAAVLCEHHGGLALYISQTPERSSLAGILSDAAIESLCAEFGGIEILIPLGPHRRVPAKVLVAKLLEEGKSLSETARCAGCSQRYVEMIRRDLKLPKPAPLPTPEVVLPSPPGPPKKYAVLAMLLNNKEGLTVREIADRTGASESYVYGLRCEFKIPPYKPR